MVRATVVLLGLGLVVDVTACKRRQALPAQDQQVRPAVPRVSPAANRPSAIPHKDPLAAAFDNAPDAAAKDAGVKETDAAVALDTSVARPPGKTDARVAAERAAAAQAAADKAVDGQLKAAEARLRGCLGKAGRVALKVKLRVRGGYITTADISGVDGATSTCLEGVFRAMRLPAAGTATVERTLKFN